MAKEMTSELRHKDGTPMRKYNSPKLQAIEMENKQTAVEWLLYNLVYHNLVDNSPKSKLWELTEQAKKMEKEQTEISDEEIEKAGWDYELNQIGDGYNHHFIEGAKWYREQLKKR